MNFLNKSLVAPSVMLLISSSLYSQELDSVTVVGTQDSYYNEYNSTSMKGEFKDIETPYSTTVTNKTLIKDIQALRLEDTYDYTTGVTSTNPRANGIIVRGFELDLQNIQINGMPGLISRFSSPTTANIEKVEILKGPASVLYGNMDSGAYINIQSKKPQAEDKITFSTSYSTYASNISSAGDDNSFTASVDATGTIQEGLYYRFIIVKEDIESFRDNVSNDNFYVYPSLLWEVSDETSLLVALEYGKEEASADEGLAVLDNDISTIADIDTVYQEDGDFDNDDGVTLSLNLEHNFKDDSKLNLAWRSVMHSDERKLYENQSVDDDDETVIRRARHQYNERDWHTFDSNYNFKAKTADMIHNMTVGATLTYRVTDFDRKVWGSNLDGIDIYDPDYGESSTADEGNWRKTKYTSKAVYFQDKIDVTKDLVLVGSFRADRTNIEFDCIRGESSSCVDNSTSSNNIVGSIGAVYAINPYVSIYASMGQSYEPLTAERVDENGDGLDSLESEQIEIGAKFNINEKLNTTVSFYKINKTNVAEKVSDNIYELVGEVESKGFEIDLQWLPTNNWQIKTGYAYNDSENKSGDDTYTLVEHNPKHTAFLFTRYNFPTKVLNGTLGISSGITYKDSVYTSSSEDDATQLPSYIKGDVGVHYDRKDWGLSLNIENITDKEYYKYGDEDYGIYAGDPRKITVNFTTTF